MAKSVRSHKAWSRRTTLTVVFLSRTGNTDGLKRTQLSNPNVLRRVLAQRLPLGCDVPANVEYPRSIELPQKVILEVVETEPTVKGQTAASSYKPAVLSNGVRTMVPPFVGAGTRIVVMTADGSYVERAKE